MMSIAKPMIRRIMGRAAALVLAVAVSFALHADAQSAIPDVALARFPVAHEHNGGWCLGYIYIYPDSVAYIVTWPASDKSHSFSLRHSDLKQISRWSRAGQPLKAVELKSSKATYHFWWLANEQDVINGRAYQKDPADAGDPDQLISAIRDPATLAIDADVSTQTAAQADSRMAPPPQQIPDSPIASAVAGSAGSLPSTAATETRFPVAHAHALTFCVGYLYVAPDHVRYEVAQPSGDKKHALNLRRSEITGVQQWVEIGAERNAAEIRTAHGNYHFWLLPDGSDLVNTPYRQWNANNIVPVGPLLAALQAGQ